MLIIDTLAIITSNLIFCLYIILMHMGIVFFIKNAAKEEDEKKKRIFQTTRIVMSFFNILFLGIIAYSSYIKFIIQIYVNR